MIYLAKWFYIAIIFSDIGESLEGQIRIELREESQDWKDPFEISYSGQSIVFHEDDNYHIYFGQQMSGIINSFKFTGNKGDPIFERESNIRNLLINSIILDCHKNCNQDFLCVGILESEYGCTLCAEDVFLFQPNEEGMNLGKCDSKINEI